MRSRYEEYQIDICTITIFWLLHHCTHLILMVTSMTIEKPNTISLKGSEGYIANSPKLYANQPRLFPYIHYFRAMASSQIVDIGIHDPFSEGYVHRVHIGSDDSKIWWRVPLVGGMEKNKGNRISTVRVNQDRMYTECIMPLVDRYRDLPYWKIYSADILDRLSTHKYLWELLVSTINWLVELLSLDCVIAIGKPATGDTVTERIASQLGCYGNNVIYIAGEASKSYLDSELYKSLTGQDVCYYDKSVQYKNFDTVSVLTPLFLFGHHQLRGLISDNTIR